MGAWAEMPLRVCGRLRAVMCYNVRVWMVVSNHMRQCPSWGQMNILNHHRGGCHNTVLAVLVPALKR